jgi:DNA polymerase
MLIGEAPGASEDALGKPFVGASGKLLDPLLSSNCIGRENIYVTNVVKCRPPGNRQPTHEEMVTCYKYLDAQIKFINPRVIILCGATALKLFNRRGKITEDHGVPFTCEGKVCLPTYHAAAALRTRSLVFDIANDLKKVKEILKNGTPDGIRDFSVVKAYQRKLYRER